jgi:hypothetical protein
MLAIEFAPILSGRNHRVAPMPYFRIDGAELRAGPSEATIALHQGRRWLYQAAHYTILRVNSPVRVRFEFNYLETTVGPFTRLEIVDGYLRTDRGEALAHYDDATVFWFVYSENKRFPSVIMEPAEPSEPP